MRRRPELLAALAAVALGATVGMADDVYWNAGQGGLFENPDNWDGDVPGFGDAANFEVPSLFTVTFGGSQVNDRVLVRRGVVSFDLGGGFYTLSSFSPLAPGIMIAPQTGDLATARVIGGELSGVYASVADQAGSVGTIELAGFPAALTLSGDAWIGRFGTAFLDASGGAMISTGSGQIAQGLGSFAQATLDGSGTFWSMDGPLAIGKAGLGILELTGGAFAGCDDAIIAQQRGSMGDALVDGPDTQWLINGTLDVGMNGLGSMTISGGAFVSNEVFATLGTFPPPDYGEPGGGRGEVHVTDPGSTWQINGELYVGLSHIGSVEVTDGASMNVAGDAFIGLDSISDPDFSTTGDLTVDGGHVSIDGAMSVSRSAFQPPASLHLALQAPGPEPIVSVGGAFSTNRDGLAVEVSLGAGFAPPDGTWRVLTAADGLTAIEQVLLPDPPAGYVWGVARQPEALALRLMPVTPCDLPEPGGVHDCNGNGIHDICDLFYSLADDCNDNGVPDDCEITRDVEFRSGYVTPFEPGSSVVIEIPNSPMAQSDVNLYAAGRYTAFPGYLEVTVNGTEVAPLFASSGGCRERDDANTIARDDFNALLVPGTTATVVLTLPADVPTEPCDPSTFIEATLSYTVFGSNDSNHNGIVDDCEPACAGDVSGPVGGEPDGNVDALDLLVLIGEWGADCALGCRADITGPDGGSDGVVDALDYLLLFAQWGSPAECD